MFSKRMLFTKDGLNKLSILEAELSSVSKSLAFSPNASSNNSRDMVFHAMTVADSLIMRNDEGFWQNKTHQAELRQHLDFLDANKGSYVADVFNEESLLVAQTILKYLLNVQPYTDFESSLFTLIGLNGSKLEQFLQSVKLILRFKIQFYQQAKEHENTLLQSQTIAADLDQLTKALLSACERDITDEDYAKIAKEYDRRVSGFFQSSVNIPYLCFENCAGFVNQSQPYTFPTNIVMLPQRSKLLTLLLDAELQLNVKTRDLGFRPLDTAYRHCCNFYSDSQLIFKYSQLTELFRAFVTDAEIYKKGSHLKNGMSGLFKKVNVKKVELLDATIAAMSVSVNKPINEVEETIQSRIFKICNALIKAARGNQAIANEKEIAVGEFSKLVDRYTLHFMQLLFSINETHDLNLQLAVNRNATAMGVQPRFIPDVDSQPLAKLVQF